MERKVVEESKKIEVNAVDIAKQSLVDGIDYLLVLERTFDHDTRKLYELVGPLVRAVVADSQNETKFDELQLIARAFIRALFAHVEGVTHVMRQVVLWACDRGEKDIDGSVQSELRNQRPRTKEGLVLAFEQFPKLFRSSFTLDKTNEGWNCFCQSIKIRDSITHPKAIMDFKMSGDAIREAQLAAVWFNGVFHALLLSCSDESPKVI